MARSDDELAQLADVADAARTLRRDAASLRRTLGVALVRAPALLRWLRGQPRLTLRLSADASGGSVLHGLTYAQPWPARCRAVGAIALPGSFEEYLRGRSKQAVRTNRRHAEQLGLAAFPTDSPGHARKLLDALIDAHSLGATVGERLAGYVAAGTVQMWCVADRDGEPIGMAAVATDAGVAQLTMLQIATDVDERSPARYLLSTEIVRGLIEQGREVLLADSMLLVSPGVVYLQRRLGFVPTRVVVRRRPFDRRWRRTAREVRRVSPTAPAPGTSDR